MPDLGTESNILVDETDGIKIRLLNYDGFQVKSIPTFCISDQINFKLLTRFRKYISVIGGEILWSPDVDKMTLITQFLFSCTNLNIPGQPNVQNRMDEILNLLGIDDPEIREKIKLLYSDSQDNVYFEDSYQKMVSLYDLKPHPLNPERALKFVRK